MRHMSTVRDDHPWYQQALQTQRGALGKQILNAVLNRKGRFNFDFTTI